MFKLSNLLKFLLFASTGIAGKVHAQLGCSVYISSSTWIKNEETDFVDSFYIAGADTKQRQIFDPDIDINYSMQIKKSIFQFSGGYNYNSVQTTAYKFYGDGEFKNTYKLHFINISATLSRELLVNQHNMQIGLGMTVIRRVLKTRTKERMGEKHIPDSQIGGVARTYWTFIDDSKYDLGIHAQFKYSLAENRIFTTYIFSKPNITLSPVHAYSWSHKKVMAAAEYRRFMINLGIGIELNK